MVLLERGAKRGVCHTVARRQAAASCSSSWHGGDRKLSGTQKSVCFNESRVERFVFSMKKRVFRENASFSHMIQPSRVQASHPNPPWSARPSKWANKKHSWRSAPPVHKFAGAGCVAPTINMIFGRLSLTYCETSCPAKRNTKLQHQMQQMQQMQTRGHCN